MSQTDDTHSPMNFRRRRDFNSLSDYDTISPVVQPPPPRQHRRWARCGTIGLFACLVVGAFVAGHFSSKMNVGLQRGENLDGNQLNQIHFVEPHAFQPLAVDAKYETHVSLDRHIYLPGDPLHFRITTLTSLTRLPPSQRPRNVVITIHSTSGAQVYFEQLTEQQIDNSSISFGTWKIPQHLSGGEYKLKCVVTLVAPPHTEVRCPMAERKFEIRNYRDNRVLVSDIELETAGYGPEETVRGVVTVTRADGGKFVDHVTGFPQLLIAGVAKEAMFKETTLQLLPSADSTKVSARFEFTLPTEHQFQNSEDVLLNIIVHDGPVTDTASKSIPVSLGTVKATFHSESGHLVAGVRSGLYVQVRNSQGQPLDSFLGEIVEDGSKVVGEVASAHDGRGLVRFVPRLGSTYTLVVKRPAGVKSPISIIDPFIQPNNYNNNDQSQVELRSYEKDGDKSVVISVNHPFPATAATELGTFFANETIGILVCTPAKLAGTAFNVSLFRRELQLAVVQVVPQVQQTSPHQACATAAFRPLDIDPSHIKGTEEGQVDAHGVLRVTVFAPSSYQPAAERLIFRHPHQTLNVKVDVLPSRWASPGSSVRLSIQVTDSVTGDPVSGSRVGVHVTDVVNLDLVEQRLKAPRLSAMVLLEDEVFELTHSPTILQSDTAIDMLLGTQSWRRYLYMKTHAQYQQPEETDRIRRLWPQATHLDVPEFDFDFLVPLKEAGGGMPEEMVVHRKHKLHIRGQHAPVGSRVDAAGPHVYGAAIASKSQDMPEFPQVQPRPQQREQPSGFSSLPYTRSDFTKTILWEPLLITDNDGKVAVNVRIGDMLTKFRVIVDAQTTTKSAFGSYEGSEISSMIPFSALAKLPPVVTEGDVMHVPVEFSSSVDSALVVQTCDATATGPLTITSDDSISLGSSNDNNVSQRIMINPQGRARHYITCTANLDHTNSAKDTPSSTNNNNNNNNDNSNNNNAANDTTTSRFELKATAAVIGDDMQQQGDSAEVLFRDHVFQSVKVVSRGFPIELGHVTGSLAQHKQAQMTVALPRTARAERVQVDVKILASSMATLAESLKGLIREPYGCFEQTSATVYPLVMAQQYFKSHAPIDEAAIARTHAMLQKGYDRLLGYEVTDGGFEWFGHAPAHEALTAYGLLEFIDMQRVFPVPQALIDRTKHWLLSRKEDASGSFLFNPRSLDSFGGAPLGTSCAYLVWALTSAGITEGLEAQVAKLLEMASTSSDSYVIALGALTAFSSGSEQHASLASELVAKLVKMQDANTGVVKGAETSITRSFGTSLEVETTALAVLAMLLQQQQQQSASQMESIQKGIEFMTSQQRGGVFGSTQGTVLALKALIAYDKLKASQAEVRELKASMLVDGVVAGEVSFLSSQTTPVGFSDQATAMVRKALTDHRTHTIELMLHDPLSSSSTTTTTTKSTLPSSDITIAYSIRATTFADTPPNTNPIINPLVLSTTLVTTSSSSSNHVHTVAEGEAVSILVSVSVNQGWLLQGIGAQTCPHGDLPMAVTLVGIPAGLELVHDKLKELVARKEISMYEVVDNHVVLYWRSFDREWVGDEKAKKVVLHTVASVPGSFLAPASSAYLYYGSEFKYWVDGIRVDVVPEMLKS